LKRFSIVGMLAACMMLSVSLPASPLSNDRSSTVVPYETIAGASCPLVRIRLANGMEGRFLFDTGTNINLISEAMVQRLNLPRHPAIGSDGKPMMIDANKQAEAVDVPIQIGELSFAGSMLIMDTQRLHAMSDPTVDGLIGANTFSKLAVLFDFEHHQVRLYYPGSLSDDDLKATGMNGIVPVLGDADSPFLFRVKARLNGAEDYTLTIDTGIDTAVIPRTVADRLKLKPAPMRSTMRTAFGPLAVKTAMMQTLAMGQITINDVPVNFPRDLSGRFPPGIGMEILGRYNMLIDFPARKLYLKPIPGMPQPVLSVRGAARVFTMPFSAVPGIDTPFVRADLGSGLSCLLALELGLPHSYLDQAVVQDHQWPTTIVQDDGGQVVTIARRPVRLLSETPAGASAGELGLPDLPFVVRDLTTARAGIADMGGSLGVNVWQRIALGLDFGRKQATFIVPGDLKRTPQEPTGAHRIPVTMVNGVMLVNGTVDGKATRFMLSSTGETLLRSPQTAAGLKPIARLQEVEDADGRTGSESLVRIHQIRIGDVSWKQPVVRQEEGKEADMPDILALDLLRRFRTTIDLPSHTLYLQPDPAYAEVETPRLGVGINPHLTNDGKLSIQSISLPSPASEAGLHVGDEILAVNGIAVNSISMSRLKAEVTKPVGTILIFTIRSKDSDKPREIKLTVRKLL
jgi:hypothetical protein